MMQFNYYYFSQLLLLKYCKTLSSPAGTMEGMKFGKHINKEDYMIVNPKNYLIDHETMENNKL